MNDATAFSSRLSRKRSNKKLTIYKMLTISFLQKVTIALFRRWLWVRAPPNPRFFFLAWVYILRGINRRHYIGSTTNLERRLTEHRSGGTHTTQRLGEQLETVSVLELETIEQTRILERQLKRKKNPKLAIAMLEHLRPPPTKLNRAAPRAFWLSGLVVGSSPTQPSFLFSREFGQATVEAIRQAVEYNQLRNFILVSVTVCCYFSGCF